MANTTRTSICINNTRKVKFGAVNEPSAKKAFARGLDHVATSQPTELVKLSLLAPLTVSQFCAFPQERHSMRQGYNKLRELHSSTKLPVSNEACRIQWFSNSTMHIEHIHNYSGLVEPPPPPSPIGGCSTLL